MCVGLLILSSFVLTIINILTVDFLCQPLSLCVSRGHSQSFQEVRGRVPAVCFSVDEQPADERAASSVHYPSLGHLSGRAEFTPTSHGPVSLKVYHGLKKSQFQNH